MCVGFVYLIACSFWCVDLVWRPYSTDYVWRIVRCCVGCHVCEHYCDGRETSKTYIKATISTQTVYIRRKTIGLIQIRTISRDIVNCAAAAQRRQPDNRQKTQTNSGHHNKCKNRKIMPVFNEHTNQMCKRCVHQMWCIVIWMTHHRHSPIVAHRSPLPINFISKVYLYLAFSVYRSWLLLCSHLPDRFH